MEIILTEKITKYSKNTLILKVDNILYFWKDFRMRTIFIFDFILFSKNARLYTKDKIDLNNTLNKMQKSIWLFDSSI